MKVGSMKLVKKHKVVALLLTAVFSLSIMTEVYAASKYIMINTLKDYTDSDSIDLNGDSVKDNVKFELNTDGDNTGTYKLSINGTSIKGDGECLEGNFRIIDINSKDKYKEIAVQELGYSDDYAMAFYSYNGEKIISMGKLYGYGTSVDKQGSVLVNARGQILCTWFYKDYYNLSKKQTLKLVSRKSYPMNLKAKVIIPISLKTSPTNSKIKVKLKKGEKITIVSSDNKKWCMVKNSKGVTGWFAVQRFSDIVGTKYSASEVFEGLPYAD